jgi:hypothetical protein
MKYDDIWATLKANGEVTFTVSKDAERRVLNGVKLVKTTENVTRKSVGKPGWSKLVIVKEEISSTHRRIKLSFLYSTAL